MTKKGTILFCFFFFLIFIPENALTILWEECNNIYV